MKKFTIAIHGGAESVKKGELDKEKEEKYREGIKNALKDGYDVLEKGGSALDAVEAAVKSMEDNPVFNAGRGGSLTKRGEVEFDAAVMDGKTLLTGATAGVRYVKNPVSLAKVILQRSDYAMLIGTGAEEYALRYRLELMDPEYFVTPEKDRAWREKQQEQLNAEHDTVGAIALDINGNLAVATSTGGLTDQLKGRVGDSPMIGGGTYANNEVCAVTCTGKGEVIIRGVLAHEVYALMKYAGNSVQAAAEKAVKLYDDKLQGDKGIVAMDPEGNIGFAFNTGFMKRGYWDADGEPYVALWEGEMEKRPKTREKEEKVKK